MPVVHKHTVNGIEKIRREEKKKIVAKKAVFEKSTYAMLYRLQKTASDKKQREETQ